MSRTYLTFLLLTFSTHALLAQGLNEAYRYSDSNLSGTARYVSMAGAFGALGGDLTAINFNPAASSVFLYSELGISGLFTANEIESSYFNTKTTVENDNFRINQGGGVFVLNNTQDSEWTRISFAINGNNINNYRYNFNVKGGNPQNSIDQYFLYFADGLSLNNLNLQDNETIDDLYRFLGNDFGDGAQQAFLGYQSYLIEPENGEDSNNTLYYSNAAHGGVSHDYLTNQEGFHRKTTFNVSGLYNNFLHLGINLNLHKIYFNQVNNLIETGYNQNSIIQLTEFENSLIANGEGFSLQVGAIAKLSKMLRVGFAYDSPQWFQISEETQQYIITERTDGNAVIEETIAPNIINVYEPYEFKIPSRITTSAALVFGKKGLISVDYSTTDYGNTKFSNTFDDNYFQTQNAIIGDNLQKVNTLRVGGELRLQNISLRAGTMLEDKRHQQEVEERKAITFGLGYDFGGSTLNLAIVSQTMNNSYQLYSQGLTDRYNLQQDRFQVSVSYHLKL